MGTQCSLQDLAVLAALARSLTLAQRALLLVEGPTFDRSVALARVDQCPITTS